ncbi:uncharacterized protein TNCT_628081 [Trichonephila clavata]|uniref:Ig-like domain-containing protein n=1 Tax=Trichonephila clavata TaxID=2740835 RepID=A0A8X6KFN6_TRICU|nr:uncharacterized protein TNCT_628081 [Trichonephila clavata]
MYLMHKTALLISHVSNLLTLGQPIPTVTWWRESVLLDDTYDILPNGVIRNELLISSLQRHDLMAVLSCQASNNNVSLPMSSSVTVDMNCKYNHHGSLLKSHLDLFFTEVCHRHPFVLFASEHGPFSLTSSEI